MKKNRGAGVLSLVVGLIVSVAVLSGGVAIMANKSRADRVALENLYRTGFYDFKTGVDNVEMSLSKLLVSEECCESEALASKAYLSSQTAIMGLSVLPVDSQVYFRTSKLINQAGDMCNSYGRALGEGKDCAVYRENIEKIYGATQRLKDAVDGISDGWTDDYRIINGKLSDFAPLDLSAVGDTKENTFEYPEIIYDGPFSDSAEKKSFKGLEGLEEIDGQRAKEIITSHFGDYGVTDLNLIGESIYPDAFVFQAKMRGRDLFISVSKKGGKIVNYDFGFTVGIVRIDEQTAKDKAVYFAQKLGYGDLTPVWYNAYEGVAYINLAPEVEGVIHYTDLVKVKIGLDNGKLIGLEALGYCANHHDREPLYKVSENTALSVVSKKIKVSNIRKALIPLRDKEIFCYEIYGSYNGLDYIVYIDAVSGKQVNIMRVINNYQGKMTV